MPDLPPFNKLFGQNPPQTPATGTPPTVPPTPPQGTTPVTPPTSVTGTVKPPVPTTPSTPVVSTPSTPLLNESPVIKPTLPPLPIQPTTPLPPIIPDVVPPTPSPVTSPAPAAQPVQPTPSTPSTPPTPPTNTSQLDTSRISNWIETQGLLKRLEASLSMRIISLYIDDNSRLDESDVAEFYYHLDKVGKQDKLGVLLYGPAGYGPAAYRILMLLRQYAKQITVIVPDKALSNLTMLALGADEILVGPLSIFSPVDIVVRRHPLAPVDADGNPLALDVNDLRGYLEAMHSDRYTEDKGFSQTPYQALTEKVHPLLIGAVQLTADSAKELIAATVKTHLQDEAAVSKIVEKLTTGYPLTFFPILPDEIRSWGLTVTQMNLTVNSPSHELIDLYKDMARKQEKVENGVKTAWNKPLFMESTGMRTWFYNENEYRMNDKNEWKRTGGGGGYFHAGVMKAKQGTTSLVARFSDKQFKNWQQGAEITEE